MKRIKEMNQGIEGIEFLREVLAWANARPEVLNENKTPNQLINEYYKTLKHEQQFKNCIS